MKKVMKKPSISKKPAAAVDALRHAKSSLQLDATEGDEENLSDAETLIMGGPDNGRKNMKPSQAPRAEASEDVPGKSPILDIEKTLAEASEDAPGTSAVGDMLGTSAVGETC